MACVMCLRMPMTVHLLASEHYGKVHRLRHPLLQDEKCPGLKHRVLLQLCCQSSFPALLAF